MIKRPSDPMANAAPRSARQSQRTGRIAGGIPLGLMVLVFFALGLAGSMIGALVPALRVIYGLDFRSAMVAQWLVLMVNGALALPVLRALHWLGALRLICWALGVIAAGCLALVLAIGSPYSALVLVALAISAMGTSALQVAGNPMTAAFGSPDKSHARLALAQAFNSLGVLGGVHLGAATMLGPGNPVAGVEQAYGIVALLILGALGLFVLGRRHFSAPPALESPAPIGAALASRWAWAGALGIALYVGAEGAIGSILINFLHQPKVLNLSLGEAGRDLANLYWGGALAGRFAGSWLLTRFPAPRLLGLAAITAAALCLMVVMLDGPVAAYAALGIGLFNAIMFPTIFSLTLIRSEAPPSAVSGLLCTAIAGGAVISIAVGELADHIGLGQAFAVPLLAYLVIAIFAWVRPASRLTQ